MLLTVPVLVAATIGFGGAGGLSSLASGPSPSAIGDAPQSVASTKSIESLTATLPVATAPRQSDVSDRGGTGEGTSGVLPATGAPTTGSPSGSSGSAVTGGGGTSGGTTTTGGGATSGVNQVLGDGQGLIDQALQGLQLNK